MRNFKLSLFALLISSTLMAQHSLETTEEEVSHEEHEHTISHGKNMIVIDYGHDHIKKGVEHGEFDEGEFDESEGHWVSSIGIDYFREISEKWEVGTKLDFQFGHYTIPGDIPGEDEIERENAFLALAVGMYKIYPKWAVYAGAGVEFEESENLAVLRLGTDYSFHIADGWAIPVGFFWDIKDGYDVYAFTVGIAKHF